MYKMWDTSEWFINSEGKYNEKIEFNTNTCTKEEISELKKIAPGREEYEKIMHEYNTLDKQQIEEVSEYVNTYIKPLFNKLFNDISNKGKASKEAKDDKNNLQEKIQDLQEYINILKENWENHYNNPKVVKYHTQNALLKVMLQKWPNKPPVWEDSWIPIPPSPPIVWNTGVGNSWQNDR